MGLPRGPFRPPTVNSPVTALPSSISYLVKYAALATWPLLLPSLHERWVVQLEYTQRLLRSVAYLLGQHKHGERFVSGGHLGPCGSRAGRK